MERPCPNRRGQRLTAVVVLTGALVAACGGDDDHGAADRAEPTVAGSTVTGATAPDPAAAPTSPSGSVGAPDAAPDDDPAATCPAGAGGSITMGTGTLAIALDPTVALGTGSSGGTELVAFYDSLMRYDPATGEYLPHMAESLTSNDDRTEWTLTLRPGITFGNGDPVDTAAVQYSIERLAASARSAAGLAQEISEFRIIDDLTIVLGTRTPNGSIPYSLSTEVGMVVNPALVEARGDGFATDPRGAGAGPFELERFAPNEEIVLVAKDDYWGGEVCLDELRFISIPGGQGTWEAFRAGELDVAFLSEGGVIAEAREGGFEAHSQISGGNGFLMLNNREGAGTEDARVRQAIALAIDTELLNDRLYDGHSLPTSCLTDPSHAIHPGVDCPPYDPETARELVARAKADGWNGQVNMVFRDHQAAVDLSIAIEAMLNDVGIDVVRENLTTSAWSTRTLAPPYEFDIADYGLALLDTGPIARLNQFFSDSVRNRSGYGSPEMDAALAALTAATTHEEIVAAMATVQQIWNEDVPSVPFMASEWFLARQPWVHGLEFNRDVTAVFTHAYVE